MGMMVAGTATTLQVADMRMCVYADMERRGMQHECWRRQETMGENPPRRRRVISTTRSPRLPAASLQPVPHQRASPAQRSPGPIVNLQRTRWSGR